MDENYALPEGLKDILSIEPSAPTGPIQENTGYELPEGLKGVLQLEHSGSPSAAPDSFPAKGKPGDEDYEPEHYVSSSGQWVLPENMPAQRAKERVEKEVGAKIEDLPPSEARKARIRDFVRQNYPDYVKRYMPQMGEAIQGATIGAGLKAIAAAESARTGEPYADTFDRLMAMQERYREEHPYWSPAIQTAAGVTSLAAAAKTLPAKAAQAFEALNVTNAPSVSRAITPAATTGWRGVLGRAGEMAARAAGAGAPLGGFYAWGETSPGATEEEKAANVLGGTLLGASTAGLFAPVIHGIGAGVQKGGGYFYDLFNPKSSAPRVVGKELEKTTISPEEILERITPKVDPRLIRTKMIDPNDPKGAKLINVPDSEKRPLTQEETIDMVDMYFRERESGASGRRAARTFGIESKPFGRYIRNYLKEFHPEGNLLSATMTSLRERAGARNLTMLEDPLIAQARVAGEYPTAYKAGEVIPKAEVQGMIEDQQNRMAGHLDLLIKRRTGDSREKTHKAFMDASKEAYNEAMKNGSPIDVTPVIQKWRQKAAKELGSNDEYFKAVNTAVDQFFETRPILAGKTQPDLRRPISNVNDIISALQDVGSAAAEASRNPNQARLGKVLSELRGNLERRLQEEPAGGSTDPNTFNISDIINKFRGIASRDFARNKGYRDKLDGILDNLHETVPAEGHPLAQQEVRFDLDKPVTNLRSFKNSRDKLQGMIDKHTDYSGDKPKPDFIATKLIELKRELNAEAYKTNTALEKADKSWGEGKHIEEIINRANGLRLNLGKGAGETLKYYNKLKSEGKDVFRETFADSLKEMMFNKDAGAQWLAGVFRRRSTEEVIRALYSAGKHDVADNILKRMRAEGDIIEMAKRTFGNSITARMSKYTDAYEQGADIATSLAMMDKAGILRSVRNALKYKVVGGGAQAQNRLFFSPGTRSVIDNLRSIQNAFEETKRTRANIDKFAHVSALGTSMGQGRVDPGYYPARNNPNAINAPLRRTP